MGELYVGLDLHSVNTYMGIMEGETKRRIYQNRHRNELGEILHALEPYRDDVKGIVVESTYNWCWLVDGLMDAGYDCVHLANPAAIKQYEGIKYTDDRHDAFWLAQLLILGILPEGYIYPKEDRPVRDLLRKRAFLMRHRTANILSCQSMIERNTGLRIAGAGIKKLCTEDLRKIFSDEHLLFSGKMSTFIIDVLDHHIKSIEKMVRKVLKVRPGFENLLTVTGIGDILAMTIMLEVGNISRFPGVGNFSSYCRCVNSIHTSNGKKKGVGNKKNGNRYLCWAFMEASNFARMYSERANAYYQRKSRETNPIIARKALANKLSRACYYIMRDQVPFREEALFS
jgi:transposase